MIFTSILGGASILPAIPVTLEFAAHLTFPVNASNSAGTCYVVGQFHSFVLTMIIQFIMESMKNNKKEKQGVEIAIWMCCGFAFVAILLGLWISPEKKQNFSPLAEDEDETSTSVSKRKIQV